MSKYVYRILLAFFIIVFLVSGYFIIDYFLTSNASKNEFNELASIAGFTVEDSTPTPEDRIASIYNLYQMNNDVVGWLQIEGTSLNYPVMQTPSNPEYYLRRDFNGEYSQHGVPFVEAACNVELPSGNLIIYGHNMKDKTMFEPLVSYKNYSFYQEHPTILFDTLYNSAEYEIVSVFFCEVDTGDENEFKYYNYIDLSTESEFNEFYQRAKALSLYDTGVTASFGEHFITLSTCEYSSDNGRMVVVAVEKE